MSGRYDDQRGPDDEATGDATPGDEAEQAEVSGLLAAVSGPPHAEAMPADVAARLDDVLAGLVSERTSAATATTAATVPGDGVVGVTDLASRRRRRWPALLVAAAAVSVLGLGVGNLLGLDGSADMEAASTADAGGAAAPETLDSAEAGAPPGEETDLADDRDAAGEATADSPAEDRVSALAALPRLRSDSLAVDAQRLEDFALERFADGRGSVRALRKACVQPELAEGDEWLSVRLDGEPAVLVLRAPADGRRTVEVFDCDDAGTAVAETTVEAP
jgi:hypothetical protein